MQNVFCLRASGSIADGTAVPNDFPRKLALLALADVQEVPRLFRIGLSWQEEHNNFDT
jgi:hypothetical protein